MLVKWLYNNKRGRALIGELINDCGNWYEVRVTSNEDKRDNKRVGKLYLVDKRLCYRENKPE